MASELVVLPAREPEPAMRLKEGEALGSLVIEGYRKMAFYTGQAEPS